MAKPHADDIHQAMSAARELSDDDSAQGKLARCFLYLHDRNLQLEDVYDFCRSIDVCNIGFDKY